LLFILYDRLAKTSLHKTHDEYRGCLLLMTDV